MEGVIKMSSYVDKKVEENTLKLAKSLVDNLRTKYTESTTQELIEKAVELLNLDNVLEFELKSIYNTQCNKEETQCNKSEDETKQLIDKSLIPLIEESEASAHFVSQVETARMLVIDLKHHESPSKSTAECIDDAISLLKLDKGFIDVMQAVFDIKQTERAM